MSSDPNAASGANGSVPVTATSAVSPSEPAPARSESRFSADDTEWIAYVSGRGAYGTGPWGLAALQAIHFARADVPDVPVWEALLPAGRFPNLFQHELIALLHAARRIVIPEPGTPAAARRISLEEDQS